MRYTSSGIIDEDDEIMATASGVYVRVNLPDDEKPGYKEIDAARAALTEEDPKEFVEYRGQNFPKGRDKVKKPVDIDKWLIYNK